MVYSKVGGVSSPSSSYSNAIHKNVSPLSDKLDPAVNPLFLNEIPLDVSLEIAAAL